MTIEAQTALVTGASRGIGRAIALELAQQGMQRVILVARDRHRLEQTATEVKALGVQAVVLPLDLTETVAVNIAIAQVWRDHGPIDVLVNCAGVAYQVPFLEARLSQVQEEIALNLMGNYAITRLIARRMVRQGGGRIVNVSSLMGKMAAPTMATYSATKFALLGFTQALRSELAAHNIQVMALLPSLTDTDMVRGLKVFRGMLPMTLQQVARVLVSRLDHNATEILVGWQSHLAVWGQRLAPGLVEWLIRLAAPQVQPSPPPLILRPMGATRS